VDRHTSALVGFRHVANRYGGEFGCCVKYLISPNPMPRLQPVIRTDFIPNRCICYRTRVYLHLVVTFIYDLCIQPKTEVNGCDISSY